MKDANHPHRYFPLFVDSAAQKAVVVGGGAIAARRLRTLTRFGFAIEIVSPAVSAECAALLGHPRVNWIQERYRAEHIAHAAIVLACTDDRVVNRAVGEQARERDIPVSVADRKEECTFFFPAVVSNDALVIGICSEGRDPGSVKRAAARIREISGELK